MFSPSILVIDDHLADPRVIGFLPRPPRVDLDARMGIDGDQRRVDGPQGSNRLTDQVGIAGAVDEVEVLTAVLEMSHGRLDAILVVFLFFVEVANAGSVRRRWDWR